MKIDYTKAVPKEEQTLQGTRIFQTMRDYINDPARKLKGFYLTQDDMAALIPLIAQSRQLEVNKQLNPDLTTYEGKEYMLHGNFHKIPMWVEKTKEKAPVSIKTVEPMPAELQAAQKAVQNAQVK